jgi:hypothetical protein
VLQSAQVISSMMRIKQALRSIDWSGSDLQLNERVSKRYFGARVATLAPAGKTY